MKVKIEIDIEDREHARAVAENLHRAAEDLPLGMSTATPKLATLRARTSITIAQLGLAIVLAGGCVDTINWRDVPTATLTPFSNERNAEAWFAHVELAANLWARAVEPVGCPRPFAVGHDGHPVTLVPVQEWTLDEHDGWTGPDTIEIKGDEPPAVALLVHELGHAMGLTHRGGPSIMTSKVGGGIYPVDIAAAACVLGCGSCEGQGPYAIF